MPMYPYLCINCGHRFEEEQKMSAAPLTTCPQCGGSLKREIMGGIGFIFNDSKGNTGIRCGSSRTCCGRDIPCDEPPCGV